MAVLYLAERISPRPHTVKSPDQYRIQRLLLAFCALDKRRQDEFLGAVNRYLYASPRQRERLRQGWVRHVIDADAGAASSEVDAGTQMGPVR
ncbi:hypothetical protein [Stenotrophomonas sp.]|uniref:hypothetical protein n=1 Tax=Stenotrophomonas sp. TaxID=69392 RepID=UPI0028A0BC40|nr:hypothetical protein [Stenotrophomonas sp.]